MSESGIAEYYAADRPELVAFLRPQGAFGTALDIGCAAGVLGKSLQDRGIVATCDGIEVNAEAARLAGTRLRRVWTGPLESLAAEIPWPQYELIILADVLEHLADPWGFDLDATFLCPLLHTLLGNKDPRHDDS